MKFQFTIDVLVDQKAYYEMMIDHLKTTITPHEDILCSCNPDDIPRLKNQMERYEGYVVELEEVITVLTQK